MDVTSRNAFMLALDELLQTKALDKITVVDLSKQSGFSRKSFYESFIDKDDLIQQIFMKDLTVTVQKNGFKDYTAYVYEAVKLFDNDYHGKLESCSHDMDEMIYSKRVFYAKAFASNSPNSLRHFFEKISAVQCSLYVQYISESLHFPLTESEKDSLASYHAAGITEIVADILRQWLIRKPDEICLFRSACLRLPYESIYSYLLYKSTSNKNI